MERQTYTFDILMPFIRSFSDYHDIDYFAEDFSRIINSCNHGKPVKIKREEINVEEFGYWPLSIFCYYGLFWIDKKPTKKEIKELLSEDEDLESIQEPESV